MGSWESRTSADPPSFLRACGADLHPQSRHHRNFKKSAIAARTAPAHRLVGSGMEVGKAKEKGKGSNKNPELGAHKMMTM